MTTTRNVLRSHLITSILALTFCLLTGCLDIEGGSGTITGTDIVGDPAKPDQKVGFDPERTICDPFKTNSMQARDRGLVGNLFYQENSVANPKNLSEYMSTATMVDATLYLNRLFIVTTPLDYVTRLESGNLVMSSTGVPLQEYVGVRMRSQLQLAPNQPAGYYQLALMSDAGSMLSVPNGLGGMKVVVNNDGKHPMKLKCASEPIYMDGSSKLPVLLEYFQGPRYTMDLVAMWRPWTGDGDDALCDKQGEGHFFEAAVGGAVAKKAFYDLLERNWQVIQNENFYFPEQENNPCIAAELPLAIGDFAYESFGRDQVTLVWTTNIPATSQAEYKDTANTANPFIATPIDTSLTQTHRLTITGLKPLTRYAFRVTATTPSGQKAVSDEIVIRLQR